MRPPASTQTVSPGDVYCILYDADCGICSRAVLWLQRQSIQEPVRWLPIASADAQRLLPNRPAEEMAVVGPKGEVWLGADGVITCLWLAGHSTATAWLWPMVRAAYPHVARHRSRISRMLGLAACRT